MTLRTPIWVQADESDPEVEYSGIVLRGFLRALFHNEGVCNTTSGDLTVSQRAAGANFSVDVSPGFCVIEGDDVADQGYYLCESTATENLVIPAAPGSGSRVHRVVAQVRDALHNGSETTYEWEPVLVEDTDGSGPPDVPDSAISLATVTVTSSHTSITDADITDTRVNATPLMGRPRWVGSNEERPLNPVTGEIIHRTDQDLHEFWTGSAWQTLGTQNPPTARLNALSNQSIPNSTHTAVAFGSEAEDTHGGHSNSSSNSRYVAPISGVYLVSATAVWTGDPNGIRELSVRSDGSFSLAGDRQLAGSGTVTLVQSVTRLMRLNAGSYVEAVVWQSSGGSLALDASFQGGSRMEICWLRP
ncbi:hypothetical protein [Actinomadura sp. SCN-SB]|uniref:hypothetical protein n=1 Tax=Actinomadura sp. SCN-SB TaxID=3373092 RepID=UPI0037520919